MLGKLLKGWLRGVDLNHRPLGYEPNELPDCSTPQLDHSNRAECRQTSDVTRAPGCGRFLALPEWRHPFENIGIEEVTRPDRHPSFSSLTQAELSIIILQGQEVHRMPKKNVTATRETTLN